MKELDKNLIIYSKRVSRQIEAKIRAMGIYCCFNHVLITIVNHTKRHPFGHPSIKFQRIPSSISSSKASFLYEVNHSISQQVDPRPLYKGTNHP